MNKTQMIKRAYVRGLAARGIYRARLRQKQAAGGLKDYAISGGVGAAGGGALGSLIGALVQYARGKNVLRGALAGGGIGGSAGLLAGLGYQYSKKAPKLLSIFDEKGNLDRDTAALISASGESERSGVTPPESVRANAYHFGQGEYGPSEDILQKAWPYTVESGREPGTSSDTQFDNWSADQISDYQRISENESSKKRARELEAWQNKADAYQKALDDAELNAKALSVIDQNLGPWADKAMADLEPRQPFKITVPKQLKKVLNRKNNGQNVKYDKKTRQPVK